MVSHIQLETLKFSKLLQGQSIVTQTVEHIKLIKNETYVVYMDQRTQLVSQTKIGNVRTTDPIQLREEILIATGDAAVHSILHQLFITRLLSPCWDLVPHKEG